MNRLSLLIFRSKVKVKGYVSLLHLVKLISQGCFVPEASNLVDTVDVVLDELMIPINIQVSRSKVKIKGQVYSRYVLEQGH